MKSRSTHLSNPQIEVVAPNGRRILGTMERCSACRPVTFSLVAGELVYKHSGGEVHHYEEQLRTVRRGGSPIFLDDQGSEWSLEQLVVRRATQMA